MQTLQNIYNLNGIPFIKSLLEYEKERFDTAYLKGSVYEEINSDFGVFPSKNPYPAYFVGDISNPKDKFVFVGINPGYDEEANRIENEYLDKEGLFSGYSRHFNFFKNTHAGLLPYYANVAGFLKRLYNIEEKVDWDWFQNNFINLELVPYHSKDANGLRVNDLNKYRERYFEALLKLIRHLDPQKPIYINGFSGFEKHFDNPVFKDLIQFKKVRNIWIGKIDQKYAFIGLPFLTRVAGGKDKLVSNIKELS